MTRPTSYWHFVSTVAFFFISPYSQVQAQVFTGDGTGDGTAYTLGSISSGNCNMMAANSDASVNYAALNDPQWDGSKNCGRCAQVSCADDRCADKSISQIVQILDRCPECKSGDLDLSPTVFKKITGLDSLSRYKIKWQFVDCPVSGNIKYCLKGGSNPYYVAIQPTNVVSGVTAMKINGQVTTMVDSAYYYLVEDKNIDLANVEVTLTSTDNQVITETVTLKEDLCTEGTLQFALGGGGTGNIGADADTVFMLQVESPSDAPGPSPETPPSPLQATPEPPVVDTTITMTTATDSDDTPAPVVTSASTPASDPPSSAPMATVVSALVPSSAPAPAPVVAPHPSVHRCKVKHKDYAKHKDY